MLPGMVPESSSGASFVSMMETAELWNRYNPPAFWRLHHPRFRRVLTQREVCSGRVIVGHERPHMPMQRGFVEDNHVVQTLPPNCSDHTLHLDPLLRRSWRRQHFPDAHFRNLSGEIVAEDTIPITQKVARLRVPGERIAELLASPFRGRMCRNTEM